MKSLALPLVLAIAASTPSAGAATHSSFCSVARGVGKDLASLTSMGTRPNVKGAYLRIRAAEPALNASAPGSLRAHLRPTFAFVNLLISDFGKVGWQPSGEAKYLPALLPKAEALSPHIRAIDAYLRGTCKLGI
jgi:hypothetical protein